MSFNPSKFQSDIFRFIQRDNGSLLIEAVAGSGKTTTIVESLKLIPREQKSLFVAFNKSIADELSKRVPEHVAAKTTHSVGFSSLRKVFERTNVDGNKFTRVFKEVIAAKELSDEESNNLKQVYYEGVRRLVGLAKNLALAPKEYCHPNNGLFPDHADELLRIMETYDIDFDDDENRIVSNDSDFGRQNEEDRDHRLKMEGADLAQKCLRRSIELGPEVIDFDDMIYLPILHGMRFWQYDNLFVDESQDVNALQMIMFRRLVKPRGRLIAVGDRRQAIYGFRGADTAAMDVIKQNFRCDELPLSICYRCPKDVIEVAKRDVPHIEAHEEAAAGKVLNLRGYDHTVFRPGDMIVCRNNGPIVGMAYSLLPRGVAVKIRGKDIGKGLIKIIEKQKADDIDDFIDKLEEWKNKEVARALKRGNEAKADGIEDKHKVIMCFIESGHCDTVKHLISKIESMYSDDNEENMVLLSSIHKAKGLEADRVFFLDSFFVPSKYAKTAEQRQQEYNLRYVAVTRAKKELFFINSQDFGKKYNEIPYLVRQRDGKTGRIDEKFLEENPTEQSEA